MEKVDYDARLHAVYAAGRRLVPEALDTWMTAFGRHLPETRPLTWLDLGSGTGRMTPALADAFGGPVHGVEPSDRMRAQAPAHPGVTYLAGSAERIPLPDASCDAALLFFVWCRSTSLADDYERLRLRAVSMFERMSQETVDAGFARIEEALPTLGHGPQHETSELLVVRR